MESLAFSSSTKSLTDSLSPSNPISFSLLETSAMVSFGTLFPKLFASCKPFSNANTSLNCSNFSPSFFMCWSSFVVKCKFLATLLTNLVAVDGPLAAALELLLDVADLPLKYSLIDRR